VKSTEPDVLLVFEEKMRVVPRLEGMMDR